MITETELRQLMEAEGYSQEEIDEACGNLTRASRDAAEAAAAWQALIDLIVQEFGRVREVWEQLQGLATTPPPTKAKKPRPPRNAGPKNKGRSWTRQPSRLARSSCRKMRR